MEVPSMNRLDGLHGTLHTERDPSLGYYRIRLGPIRLFWKPRPAWEVSFVDDDKAVGFQVILPDK